MDISDAVAALTAHVPDPSLGLPDEVFYYISRTTPLLNVDLLIKDENGRTLLTWRNDQYSGKGWHVPGGIIRFKELMDTRVRKVAETELGITDISFDPIPMAINQIIQPDRDIRGHFVSFLYKCFVSSAFVPRNEGLSFEDRGFAVWHDYCPDDLLKFHEMYRKFI